MVSGSARSASCSFAATESCVEGIGRARVEPSFMPGVIDRMIAVEDADSIGAMRALSDRLGRRVGGSTGTTATQSFANLSSGNYYYGVLGGFFPKGSYSLQSAATAVPEPAALLLALMGVGGLAVAARRKRKSSNAVG